MQSEHPLHQEGGIRPQKPTVPTPWMTTTEVATYLSVSLGTVRNWVSQKFIPYSKRGGLLRFHRQVIDEWLSRGACKGRLHHAPDCSASFLRR